MLRRNLLLPLLPLLLAACHFNGKNSVTVCLPIDGGFLGTTDGGSPDGSSSDAGSMDASSADDGGLDDAGSTDDAGSDDAGSTDDAGSDDAGSMGDAGPVDAGSAASFGANQQCQTIVFQDAGVCADLSCRTTADCCDGTTCVLDPLPTCANCDLVAVASCVSSSPCPLGTTICVALGADGTCTCPDGNKNVCAPTCLTAGCGTDFQCNRFTQVCDPVPCDSGFTCPEWMTCAPGTNGPTHGCVPKTCLDSSDCVGATCLNGLCQAFLGTCQY